MPKFTDRGLGWSCFEAFRAWSVQGSKLSGYRVLGLRIRIPGLWVGCWPVSVTVE